MSRVTKASLLLLMVMESMRREPVPTAVVALARAAKAAPAVTTKEPVTATERLYPVVAL